jgi:SAM-dependent methyltransferase
VNTALQSNAEVEEACAAVVGAGLPPHGDRPKNWDLLVALGLILDRVPRSGAVLEMGATQYSRLLPWLYLYGYRALRGIDLIYSGPLKAGPIRYDGMDLTRTSFPDASFDAIATLSVVEHSVDLGAYLREAARLLKPGGVLITSTDYWCEPVGTGGQEAYGGPIRIFGPNDIRAFAQRTAAAAGLVPVRDLDLVCDERPVEWKRFGLRYTFVNVVLEKVLPVHGAEG